MSEATLNFEGRVAVVTGAGGGLGKTYALELGRRGAKVVVNDLGGTSDGSGGGSSMADAVVQEIIDAGGEAVANYDSVATPEGGQGIIQTALDSFGKIDVLINNAGILRDSSFAKLEVDNMSIVMDVHLRGAFYVTQPAFKVMRAQGYGRILFTSSAVGLFGNFGQANYAAAKMGILGLSNVLAIEGAKYNIQSNAIAPIARTRLTEEVLGPLAEALAPDLVTPLALYLVSEQSTSTQEIYSVGGGRYARVAIGVTQGWMSKETPTVEDIASNFTEIQSTENLLFPNNLAEEIALLAQALNS